MYACKCVYAYTQEIYPSNLLFIYNYVIMFTYSKNCPTSQLSFSALNEVSQLPKC